LKFALRGVTSFDPDPVGDFTTLQMSSTWPGVFLDARPLFPDVAGKPKQAAKPHYYKDIAMRIFYSPALNVQE
jgi:hypothetical protein